MYLNDMRLLRLDKAEYLIPAEDVALFDRLLQRRSRRLPINYVIEPVPPPRDEFAADRGAEIERAVSRMPFDDGDALPEGHYVVNETGGLVRTGHAKVTGGLHGATAPTDEMFDLEPHAPGVDGRRHLRDIPAIYTTPDPLIAQDVAFEKWRDQRDEGKGDEQRHQPGGVQPVVNRANCIAQYDFNFLKVLEVRIDSLDGLFLKSLCHELK